MPSAPQIPTSAAASLMHVVVLLLLAGGALIAISAIPAVRKRFAEHLEQVHVAVNGTASKPTVTSTASVADLAPQVSRREIESFDLSIFEE